MHELLAVSSSFARELNVHRSRIFVPARHARTTPGLTEGSAGPASQRSLDAGDGAPTARGGTAAVGKSTTIECGVQLRKDWCWQENSITAFF